MVKISPSYRLSICVSVFLHIILLVLLSISTQNTAQNGYRFSDQNKSMPIINAVAVDQQIVSNQETKKQKQIAKKTYKKKLQRQVITFKKKKIIEQKQLPHMRARQLQSKQQQEHEFTAWKQVLTMKKQRQNALLAKRQKQLQEELFQQEMAQEKAQVAKAQRMAQMQCILNQYKAKIIHIIEQQWIVPTTIRETNKNLLCILLIRLAPGGHVLSVKTVQSSGDVVLDRSARMAVFKASPLPVPKNMTAFSKFRELRLTVRPVRSL